MMARRLTPLLRWQSVWRGQPLLRRAPRWPAPDFLGGRPRLSWLAVAALLAAAATLAMCALDVVQGQARIAEVEAQLGQWQRRATTPPRRTATALPSTAAPSAAVLRALRRGARHPWPLLFTGVESVSALAGEGGVSWLALEHERERGDIRLEGIARNAGLVLKIVDGLAAEPGWSHVVLTRLADAERADGPGAGVRFEITGQLDRDATVTAPLALAAGDAR